MTGINTHFSKFPNPKIQTSKLTKKKTRICEFVVPNKGISPLERHNGGGKG